MAEGVVGPGMPGKAPSGERAAFWRTVIAEWSSSGQSKVAFCKARGLSPSAFHWWKGELARRAAAQGKSLPAAGAGQNRGAKASPFVPLRVVTSSGRSIVGPACAPAYEGAGMELVLANGRRVRVGSDFDAEVLVQVVQVLEGMPC